MTRRRRTPGVTGPWPCCPRSSLRGGPERRLGASSRSAARSRRRRPRERRLEPREDDLKAGCEGKRREGRADRKCEDHDHEVQGGPRNPACELRPSPRSRAVKELLLREGPSSHHERIRDDDSAQRLEETADQEEEPL